MFATVDKHLQVSRCVPVPSPAAGKESILQGLRGRSCRVEPGPEEADHWLNLLWLAPNSFSDFPQCDIITDVFVAACMYACMLCGCAVQNVERSESSHVCKLFFFYLTVFLFPKTWRRSQLARGVVSRFLPQRRGNRPIAGGRGGVGENPRMPITDLFAVRHRLLHSLQTP